jgi:vancomycin resistance protein YoaR
VSSASLVTVVPSRDGHQLDDAAVAAAILRGNRSIVATIRDEHPAHDTAWAKKLGITHQVSSFTTNYIAGEPRVHNIHLAADTLNNTVVEPGKTFSLNDKLGPRTPEKGYVSAPILLEDGIGEDFGGGISQLTTTLFNAVFFGGYVDVDHSPHHYYISRYPMGREATIVYPYVDLKFRNDTKHGVLIRATYSATSVTVTFYGNTDGRVATEANRKVLHTEPITDRLVTCPVKKPTDDPNNECATLTAFERKISTAGETGYDVEFDRVIEQPGHPPVRQHYRVHYPMLPNTVLVGTAPPTTTTTKPKTTTTRPKTTTTRRAPPKTTTTAPAHP